MFHDRTDAARQLAERIEASALKNPLVLGIPRGGVVVGAVLAESLGAELDVVLVRKLRAPFEPELAIGALGEDGDVFLTDFARDVTGFSDAYLAEELARQAAEIARRRHAFRMVRPRAVATGRSVILADDGIATGATMLAALHVLKMQKPVELIVAVPVAPPDTLALVARHCDQVVCLLEPAWMAAIGAFYADFEQVEDAEVLRLLGASLPMAKAPAADERR
ncbi:MAG: phosphoribosyltransferase [Rhodocyclaceae bacterium]|nr:phosphoribosyltransferase [Rhodocyclaceae bacterium]